MENLVQVFRLKISLMQSFTCEMFEIINNVLMKVMLVFFNHTNTKGRDMS